MEIVPPATYLRIQGTSPVLLTSENCAFETRVNLGFKVHLKKIRMTWDSFFLNY